MTETETTSPRGSFTAAQVDQLLRPINPRRVLRDGKGHSHVSQQDVTAHLIRVFGFGSFDTEVLAAECVFETERADRQGVTSGRWDVCYRALLRLTVRDPAGRVVCVVEDGSTATAQNQTRGDGHDLAYKSALSLSKKRAAINLGDQFGLSLYNHGQMEALVMRTFVVPETPGEQAGKGGDVQEGVTQQVALGHDEADVALDAEASPAVTAVTAAGGPPAGPSPEVEAAARVAAWNTGQRAGWEGRLAGVVGDRELALALFRDAQDAGVLGAPVTHPDGKSAETTLGNAVTWAGTARTPAAAGAGANGNSNGRAGR